MSDIQGKFCLVNFSSVVVVLGKMMMCRDRCFVAFLENLMAAKMAHDDEGADDVV